MTGKSPRKKVDALYWQGRLRVAQAYLEAAQQTYLLAQVGQGVFTSSAPKRMPPQVSRRRQRGGGKNEWNAATTPRRFR